MYSGPRPKLALPVTLRERLVEAAGAGLITGFVMLAIFELPGLPAVFPVLLGGATRPVAWGTPNVLALLPAVAAATYVALSVLQRFPEHYHYPGAVTEASAPSLYRRGRSWVRALKLSLTLTFAIMFCVALGAAKDSPQVFQYLTCEQVSEDQGLECSPALSIERLR